MILNMGVRTTDPVLVAYRALGEGEDETSENARMLIHLNQKGANLTDMTMIVTHESTVTDKPQQELMVPLSHDVDGVDTKILPAMRIAFLLYSGKGSQTGSYMRQLQKYIQQVGLRPSKEILGIEAYYLPEDLDARDWQIEVMVPLED